VSLVAEYQTADARHQHVANMPAFDGVVMKKIHAFADHVMFAECFKKNTRHTTVFAEFFV
jgi:hypothetical protein